MSGTIWKRGKNSWHIRFDTAPIDGKRVRRRVTIRGSYADAKKELTRLVAARDSGILPTPTAATVGAYLQSWLDTATGRTARTVERYRELSRQQICPALADVPLQKLSPEMIRHWHATLIDKGLSARTTRHAHALLRQVLATAVKDGKLARNVADVHRPPRVEDKEIEILTAEQIAEVLTKLDGHSLYPVVSLAIATGMRRSELLALAWGAVDLDGAFIRVERSVEEAMAGLRLKAPKTKRSRRSITLPPEAVAMLRTHRVQQMELRLAIGAGAIRPDTLVFSNVEGELIRPRNLTKAWDRARVALKLPAGSFHSLRHSHASLLIAKGVDIVAVSRRLGHANAAITLNCYAHLLTGADAAAAKAIEGVLK
jgi:integrase